MCVDVRPSEWKRETGSSGNERGTITQHAGSEIDRRQFQLLVEREREREKKKITTNAHGQLPCPRPCRINCSSCWCYFLFVTILFTFLIPTRNKVTNNIDDFRFVSAVFLDHFVFFIDDEITHCVSNLVSFHLFSTFHVKWKVGQFFVVIQFFCGKATEPFYFSLPFYSRFL